MVDVNVVATKDVKGPSVSLPDASDASNDASVWAQAADHFRRWRAGEPFAIDDLVRTLTPVLWHVVRSYGLGRGEAEDVVQTTWLALVRSHTSISDPQAVTSWLTTTARREAWRVLRATSRAVLVGDEVIEVRTAPQRPVEVDAIAAEESDRLWDCVRLMSLRCQALLRIVAFDDRPDYAGIAAHLQMPIGSIGPTRGRCLDKLKTLLAMDCGPRR